MAFRKIKAKKYNGIQEYFNPKSNDKETRALYISFRDEVGKPTLQKVNTLDKPEALTLLNNIKAEVERKKNDAEGDILVLKKAAATKTLTLKQAADIYYDSRDGVSIPATRKKTKDRVLSTKLGEKRLSKITIEDLKSLQKKLSTSLAPKTTNQQMREVRSVFTMAIAKKWITGNPFLELKKLEENHQPGRVMSPEELQKMYDVFQNGDYDLSILPDPALYFFTKLLLQTGARPASVIDTQVKDCRLSQKKIDFKALKKGKAYSQSLTDEMVELVAAWIKKHELTHDDYLFHPGHNKSKPIHDSALRRNAQKTFDKLFNVGMPVDDVMHRVGLYTLRRTAGTMMYKKHGIMHAMLFLNHTSVKTTQKYLNVEGDIGQAVNDVF